MYKKWQNGKETHYRRVKWATRTEKGEKESYYEKK
jgi:hypothetical protein